MNRDIHKDIKDDIHNGKYHFFYKSKLSNFNINPFEVFGKTFQCGEQALHWSKAMFFNDLDIAQQIWENGHIPSECLRLGRLVKNYDDVKWDNAREDIMYEISLARFTQIENLKLQLLETGDKILVEAS